MHRLSVDTTDLPQELAAGLDCIAQEFPHRFGGRRRVRFHKQAGDGAMVTMGPTIEVRYAQKSDAFRALGRLLADGGLNQPDFVEQSWLRTRGIMLDVSRNGVLRPQVLRQFFCRAALMGLNLFMLYTEDTYEVPGEPMFGYLRGGYSQAEIKALDDQAHALGIELCPCIQTLGHMTSVLQWPAFSRYADTENVLLARDPETLQWIGKLIDAATAPLRSRRIHVGMDEAYALGTGGFMRRHGYVPALDIFVEHLRQVAQLCSQRGLRPMIWSDMAFRGSHYHGQYDLSAPPPKDVAARIPSQVQLVFWDYYHLDQSFYEQWIDRHRALGSDPIMAGGIWTWNRFWTTLPFTFRAMDACLGACRAKRLPEAIMTLWADGGAEVDFFSALPGMQYFAEHAYSPDDTIDLAVLRQRLRGSCMIELDHYLRASDLDAVPCLSNPDASYTNVSKWLLWQDPLLGIMDHGLQGVDLSSHYRKLASDLLRASRKGGESRRLRLPALLAQALVLKADLGQRLLEAYRHGDRRRLSRIVRRELPLLQRQVRALRSAHRDLWMANHKPFGWESIDRRYGGLLARLETVQHRVKRFLARKGSSIPELESPRQAAIALTPGELPMLHASRVATPSYIK